MMLTTDRTRRRTAPKKRASAASRAERDIVQHLREQISSHAIPPGAKLRESTLAQQFSVSRTKVREALTALETDVPRPTHLRLAGGGSTAPAWRQMLADALSAELDAVDVPAASGRGAAMLGAQGAGLLEEVALLNALTPKVETVAQPHAKRTREYQHRFDKFRDRIDRLRPPHTVAPDLAHS